MERNEQTITMTIDDFRALVKEEVEKQMKFTPERKVFPSATVIPKKIEEINKISKESFLDSRKVKKTHYNFTSIVGADYNHNADTDLNFALKKLAKGIYGKKLNSDLTDEQWRHVSRYYDDFLNLFLKFYEERIKREYEIED